MPIGYRMDEIAMREVGVSHIGDHGAFGLSEMGVGHPQTCMIDGFMAVTGCTYGKLMMERLNYGKVACLLVVPGKGAVRVCLKSEFQDQLANRNSSRTGRKGSNPRGPGRRCKESRGYGSDSLRNRDVHRDKDCRTSPSAARKVRSTR